MEVDEVIDSDEKNSATPSNEEADSCRDESSKRIPVQEQENLLTPIL